MEKDKGGLEWITNEQLDRACRKQEKKNLKEKQQSATWVSMLPEVHDFIVVEVSDTTILIRKGWRDVIKAIA